MGWRGEGPQPGLCHPPAWPVSTQAWCVSLADGHGASPPEHLSSSGQETAEGGGEIGGGLLVSPRCHQQVFASPCHLLPCPILLPLFTFRSEQRPGEIIVPPQTPPGWLWSCPCPLLCCVGCPVFISPCG